MNNPKCNDCRQKPIQANSFMEFIKQASGRMITPTPDPSCQGHYYTHLQCKFLFADLHKESLVFTYYYITHDIVMKFCIILYLLRKKLMCCYLFVDIGEGCPSLGEERAVCKRHGCRYALSSKSDAAKHDFLLHYHER